MSALRAVNNLGFQNILRVIAIPNKSIIANRCSLPAVLRTLAGGLVLKSIMIWTLEYKQGEY
jgi:hypothetical protein